MALSPDLDRGRRAAPRHASRDPRGRRRRDRVAPQGRRGTSTGGPPEPTRRPRRTPRRRMTSRPRRAVAARAARIDRCHPTARCRRGTTAPGRRREARCRPAARPRIDVPLRPRVRPRARSATRRARRSSTTQTARTPASSRPPGRRETCRDTRARSSHPASTRWRRQLRRVAAQAAWPDRPRSRRRSRTTAPVDDATTPLSACAPARKPV